MEKRIPSPEELFGSIEAYTETVSVERREPIPGYRIVNRYSGLWVLVLLVVVTVFFLLNPLQLQYFYMNSASMQSEIPEGSLILVRKTDIKKLTEGDIITFYNDDEISVTHEIVEIKKEETLTFQTQGIENKSPDKEPVTEAQVVGKVIFHVPYVGMLFGGE